MTVDAVDVEAVESGLLCPLRHRTPVMVEDGLAACWAHVTAWADLLAEIDDQLRDVVPMLLPGASGDGDVGVGRITGVPLESKPPMSLDVVDLFHVGGRDGFGSLRKFADLLTAEKRFTKVNQPGEVVRRLRLNLRWLAGRVDPAEFDSRLRRLASWLRRVAGEPRARTVGVCSVLVDGDDGVEECGGDLRTDRLSVSLSVSCVSCGDRWNADELARLGAVLGAR